VTEPIASSRIDIEKLAAFDACTLSNAIEQMEVRLRNEGFIVRGSRCRFPSLPPMIGYAATGRVRTAEPPIAHRCYYDRMDWWTHVASLPEPRVMVLQDMDSKPGFGAFVGEIHAAIGTALHCVGCVTNGAVRDLPAVEAMGFQMFSGNVSVSHSYAHIIELGAPVEIGGLKISSGDLIAGDRHGVLRVPRAIASQIPAVAATIRKNERELLEFCKSPEFSLEELSSRITAACAACDLPWTRRRVR
jgi:4-hydroxy-4-methyl-2-oxoglutarate aldolase